jgi:hypothetical protein
MAFTLEEVKILAWEEDLVEIYFNYNSRVVSFSSGQGARINVYWTTGTVGTCIDHPVKGKTQLFRKNCDEQELRELMRDPRLHTGKGYYVRQDLKCGPEQVEEAEEMLRQKKQREEKEKERREELLRQKRQREAEEIARRKAKRQREMMGSRTMIFLNDMDFWKKEFSFSNALSLTESGGLVIVDDDGYCYGERCRVSQIIWSRGKHLPKATFISIGSQGRYFVQYENGDWKGTFSDRLDKFLQKCNKVRILSFGNSFDDYYVMDEDGNDDYYGLPLKLFHKLDSRNPRLPKVQFLSLAPQDGWFVRWEDNKFEWAGIPENIANECRKNDVKRLFFCPCEEYSEWFVMYYD